MALAIAQEGGIGVIHKSMTIERQAREVRCGEEVRVRRDPATASPIWPDATVRQRVELTREHSIFGVPVVQRRGACWAWSPVADVRFEPDLDGRRGGYDDAQGSSWSPVREDDQSGRASWSCCTSTASRRCWWSMTTSTCAA
ncbi:MAG: IMP dehydrogenase [Gammaproteobacteria bacterium]|nr:IMP dehydrogenase [Gammaproteobacteria bacterium]